MRRYEPMHHSRGTVIPLAVRHAVNARDKGCVGPRVGMDGPCSGSIELDHVRASHAIGKKSETTVENLTALCGFHHRIKTEAGRIWRPRLLAYLETA